MGGSELAHSASEDAALYTLEFAPLCKRYSGPSKQQVYAEGQARRRAKGQDSLSLTFTDRLTELNCSQIHL